VEFLTPSELDAILRWKRGTAERLARAGQFPHVLLPDGSIRFEREATRLWIACGEVEGQPILSREGGA
jgi:hypothetical protein